MKKLILAFIISLSANLAFSQDKDAAEKLVGEGIALHDKREFEKAISKYDKALELDADNLFALAEKALSLHSLHRYDEAIVCCKTAVEKHPHHDALNTVYVTYGNALDGLKKPNEAIELYDEGLKVFPEYYQLHFNKGITLIGLKEYDEALSSFNQSISHNPKHGSSHNAVGRILYSDKKRIPAILAISRFLVIEPQGQRAKDNLGLLQEMMNGNVEQTGKNSISININADAIGDTLPNGKPKENSFRTADMILSMDAALDFDKKNSKKSPREQFLRKFETLCSSLKESQKDNHGFYWEYYVPYFIEMKDKGYLETFSYLAFATSDDKSTEKWLKANDAQIDSFYAWSSKFSW